MAYTDENGITAFLQADDVFKWGGVEMVKFYMQGDFHFEFWHNFVKRFSIRTGIVTGKQIGRAHV